MTPTLKATDKIQYGFKRLSMANLFEPDDHPAYPSRLRGEKWVRECLKPQLAPGVPEEVAFLFESARGSMVYGLFFLPLAALATEEGFRVLEAGVRHRCKQLGLGKKSPARLMRSPTNPTWIWWPHCTGQGKCPKRNGQSGNQWWRCGILSRIGHRHPSARVMKP